MCVCVYPVCLCAYNEVSEGVHVCALVFVLRVRGTVTYRGYCNRAPCSWSPDLRPNTWNLVAISSVAAIFSLYTDRDIIRFVS